jgi:hypothetical protein
MIGKFLVIKLIFLQSSDSSLTHQLLIVVIAAITFILVGLESLR